MVIDERFEIQISKDGQGWSYGPFLTQYASRENAEKIATRATTGPDPDWPGYVYRIVTVRWSTDD